MGGLIDGRKIANEIQRSVREKCLALKAADGKTPMLISLTVGNGKDSEIYVKAQEQAALATGIDFDVCKLENDVSQSTILDKIQALNMDDAVTAVIVQHPLPTKIDHHVVISSLTPEKDAEGIHPSNLGKIFRREADILPCTPGAVMKILNANNVGLFGKEVVIIGHSPIVGKPLSLMMLNETATTTVCHIGTAQKGDIKSHTSRADILVVAVGKPAFVKSDWIKEGAVVVDVGINNIEGKIVGDVDFDDVKKRASLITPVPGGVGPVTVSILMRNVLRAYKAQHDEL